jgi:membrane-associated phospholipid phosphatase
MRTNYSVRFRWVIAFAFCWSVAMTGQARGQEIAPAREQAGPAAAAASDAPASDDNPAPGQTAPNTSPGQTAAQTAATVPTDREVSERTIFTNFLHDQKDLWLFPVTQIAHGHHWIPAVVVVGVTGGLMAADAHDEPYFRRTTSFSGFNRAFSGNITMSETLIAPASFYVVGLFDKDAYTRKTGLLAAEALADVTVLELAMKGVTRRLRPSDIPPNGNFSDTFFSAKGNPFSTSFPSGHAISAFAVATIIASRYGRGHRWVPFVAFGAAALIGFSRISLQAHFPSDVFLGAALGFAVAQFDVLRAPGFGPLH